MAALSVSRACKGCSQLKVRCQPGPSDSSSCERCLQAGRTCVPADKRRRPRDRIAELEAQVAALSRALQKQQLGDRGDRTSPSTTDTASNSTSSPSATQPPPTVRNAYSFSSTRPTGETAIAFLDARVPRAAQQQAVDLYVKRLWPLIPCFSLIGTDLDTMRRDKSVLFFSIVTFTAPFSLVPSAVRSELLRESMCMFAVELISKPNRRLDTVWSLLVACFFFRAQHGSAHVTVHQLTQMATSMAIDLGLGGAQLPAAPGVALSSTASTPGSVPELEAIEHCASPPASSADPSSPTAPYCTMATKADAQCAWLSCFMSASNLAIGIRRPDASAQWTAHNQSCLDDLTRGFAVMPPDAAHETLFLHMVRGERLCQQVVDAVKLCEPSVQWDVTSLENAQTMATLQTEIDNWTAETTTALVHASNFLFHKILLFYRYATVIYLHEPVLHTATNKLSFGAPFRRSKLAEHDVAHPQVTGKHVASLYALKDACLALLDLATSELDDEDTGDENDNTLTAFLSDAPLSFISKLFHAFFILAKLHIAVTAPGNTYGVVLRPAELRFAPYPGRLAGLADRIERRNPGSFHYKILACAGGAGEWFAEYEANRAKGTLQTPDEESSSSSTSQAQFTQPPDLENSFFYGEPTPIMATDTTADDMAAYLTAYGQSASTTLTGNTGFDVDDAQWQMLDRYISSFNG
ncbi:hypothetical protein Sste5346_008298 [Sporothrix stenoceras]|uniref:Zn(2)-C6 fungal-type domain-containing protein n=1 Tax=Sporothrix stenoceras TaxID=5173 RepID=A0ABR3YPR5_9PEZI